MVSRIISAIQNNLLVCFPTETVYALACNALDSEAIRKICQVKKRSKNKPLSVFVADICGLMGIAKLDKKYTHLINQFSPGPITYILPLKGKNILPNEFFKGSVGIRIPDHPIAISILNKLKTPVVATSVNISGEQSIYKAEDIPKPIKQHLSAIVEDDKLVSGVESTIIDLTQDEIKIIREGVVSLQMVCNILSYIGS
ncbi:threonylcarbamoyl-AMP synthase [Wolbachia endosymbiont of Cruorifilaria tuberocauda]|uniref:L-threonylcarbamoyladenylate synthase n=1 Tax=Wolbachia endosymbiont of Cruorifilaria tuberocauda TaxID=1812111 RepID=UPI00158B519C|nr:L-threonylcarbamoyladenylate synthase [Wolbachia endosymbiont of Cruorifilaria tuberocauda]QKX01494.1 threonylcarbamoyl-AMP synthase [Wolbachia endosymbiont of Cruorifilaria tuberocauda]